jgi:hypothetical protein
MVAAAVTTTVSHTAIKPASNNDMLLQVSAVYWNKRTAYLYVTTVIRYYPIMAYICQILTYMAYIISNVSQRHDSRYIIVDTDMVYILTYIADEESDTETENVTGACIIQPYRYLKVPAVRP